MYFHKKEKAFLNKTLLTLGVVHKTLCILCLMHNRGDQQMFARKRLFIMKIQFCVF